MLTSLWKDHSEEAGPPIDLASLRQQYVADGFKVSERLKQDSNVLAMWLSGPFDMSRVMPRSDLHIAVLIRSGRGVLYNHQLQHFSEVKRRLEIAFFTLRYLQTIVERGYSQWSEVFDSHKLHDVEILHDRCEILGRFRRDFARVKPRKLLVGRQIELINRQLSDMEHHLSCDKRHEAILHARKVLMSSLMLHLLAAKGCMPSKISCLYPELKERFPSSEIEAFDIVQALTGLDESMAARRVRKIGDFVRHLFERQQAGR